ncbi:hypothetical protein [Streptomyces sp. NPDC058741]
MTELRVPLDLLALNGVDLTAVDQHVAHEPLVDRASGAEAESPRSRGG